MKTLIVSGGNANKEFVKQFVDRFDNIIAVDKGLEILDKLNILPTHIIGDFDSVDKRILKKYEDIKSYILNAEKDYTDTHMAIELAINLESKENKESKECKEIVIISAIGTRIDHVLANVHDMNLCLKRDIKCKMINENNEIFLINKNTYIEKDENYKYISLIPLTTEVTGITLKGFKYIIENYTLNVGDSRAISNEQIDKKALIELKEGILIVIKSKD
jgi:thiamine pyrophosphokinase